MPASQTELRQIQDLLVQEVTCYRELLAVVDQERAILLSGEHQGLNASAERKLELAKRLEAVRAERLAVMARLSPDPRRPLRLRDLAASLPPAERAPFKALLGKAQELAEAVNRKNQSNQGFVQEALDTVEHLLGLLSGRGGGQTYGQGGRRQAAPTGPPRLLTREV
ncbi:MAG: flagellar protein FlgN [Thermodesulfobacteriota bacterium]